MWALGVVWTQETMILFYTIFMYYITAKDEEGNDVKFEIIQPYEEILEDWFLNFHDLELRKVEQTESDTKEEMPVLQIYCNWNEIQNKVRSERFDKQTWFSYWIWEEWLWFQIKTKWYYIKIEGDTTAEIAVKYFEDLTGLSVSKWYNYDRRFVCLWYLGWEWKICWTNMKPDSSHITIPQRYIEEHKEEEVKEELNNKTDSSDWIEESYKELKSLWYSQEPNFMYAVENNYTKHIEQKIEYIMEFEYSRCDPAFTNNLRNILRQHLLDS